jgi:hypothetical protein
VFCCSIHSWRASTLCVPRRRILALLSSVENFQWLLNSFFLLFSSSSRRKKP